MRSKFLIIVILFGSLYGLYLLCCKGPKKTSEHTTLLIQALPNSLALKTIIDSLSKKINDIIKEELNLDQNFDLDFFVRPKPAQKLTLYYINDINKDGCDILFSSLDTINIPNFIINSVSLGSTVEFFGGAFGENDELVIMINDPNKELSHYNEIIKNTAHKANELYKETHDHDLYDITKSEQYPYLPHIGVGRVRSTSIKNNLKDPSQYVIVFERIQSRIKQATLECMEQILNQDNKQLTFDTIGILDLNKRTYIKEYLLINQ